MAKEHEEEENSTLYSTVSSSSTAYLSVAST
jgi:hypothetical protein